MWIYDRGRRSKRQTSYERERGNVAGLPSEKKRDHCKGATGVPFCLIPQGMVHCSTEIYGPLYLIPRVVDALAKAFPICVFYSVHVYIDRLDLPTYLTSSNNSKNNYGYHPCCPHAYAVYFVLNFSYLSEGSGQTSCLMHAWEISIFGIIYSTNRVIRTAHPQH